MRTLGLPLSKAQMMPSGWKVSTILMNMLKKPKIALVGVPSGAVIVGGIAWKARCISELPSITAITCGAAVSCVASVSCALARDSFVLIAACVSASLTWLSSDIGLQSALLSSHPF